MSALVGEPWFWLICDRVIWDRSPVWRQQAQLLTAATRLLSGILVAADRETAEKVWNALEGVTQEIEHWNPIDEEGALAAELLLDRMREKKRGHYREICNRLVEGAARFPA